MARSGINKVILVGNLGQDPEVRFTAGGAAVTTLSLATSESWKDRNSGEKQERTQWHNISILSEPLVNIAESFLKKGSKVYLEGQVETRKWQDSSGADRYSTEIVLRANRGQMVLVDKKSEMTDNLNKVSEEGMNTKQDSISDLSSEIIDDEIPF